MSFVKDFYWSYTWNKWRSHQVCFHLLFVVFCCTCLVTVIATVSPQTITEVGMYNSARYRHGKLAKYVQSCFSGAFSFEYQYNMNGMNHWCCCMNYPYNIIVRKFEKQLELSAYSIYAWCHCCDLSTFDKQFGMRLSDSLIYTLIDM